MIEGLAWRWRSAFGTPLRDTDADWTRIGAKEPYWGVLTDPKYRRDNLEPGAVDGFYASGVTGMEAIVAELARAGCSPMRARSALDFGCGRGPLDGGHGALRRCCHGPGCGQTDAGDRQGAGNGPSGMSIPCPMRASTGSTRSSSCNISHRSVAWAYCRICSPGWSPAAWSACTSPSGANPVLRVPRGFAPPPGEIMMYDYAFSAILETLNRNGIERFSVVSTDHGGHHGAHIFGRRSSAPAPQL